jgi:hypothetical protein
MHGSGKAISAPFRILNAAISREIMNNFNLLNIGCSTVMASKKIYWDRMIADDPKPVPRSPV